MAIKMRDKLFKLLKKANHRTSGHKTPPQACRPMSNYKGNPLTCIPPIPGGPISVYDAVIHDPSFQAARQCIQECITKANCGHRLSYFPLAGHQNNVPGGIQNVANSPWELAHLMQNMLGVNSYNSGLPLPNSNLPQTDTPLCNDDGLTLAQYHFQVVLDIKPFTRDEIGIGLNDRILEVKGNHKEYTAGGSTTHNLSKQYTLPRPMKVDAIQMQYSPNGILFITAPWA